MEESAPEGIIKTPEQGTQKLQQGVKAQLRAIGHHADVVPESEKPPPLTEELKQVGGDVIHAAGSAFEEGIMGTSGTTHVRTAEGGTPISIAAKRLVQKGQSLFRRAA